jgi:ornithine cyclodeaminase/alanine dehydrogenase-like protein (mu-crystallin family)
VLGARDVAALVARVGLDALVDELIAGLVDALERHDDEVLVTQDRAGFHYQKPDLGLVEWMPAMEVGRAVAIKTVAYHPSNPEQRAMPSVLATTALFDTTSGEQLVLCEASTLTAMRTGAASAIATDILAPEGPVTLGLVGAGAQAVAQVHAISRVRRIERVLVADVSRETSASLPARLAFLDLPVTVVDIEDVAGLVGHVDVLCTCTSVAPGEGPVIADGDHRPGLHVNAVGADFAGKVELPRALLERSLVVPDVRSQCLLEGECQQLSPDAIGPDLAGLVQDRARYRSRAGGPTVFDSTGWSLEDMVAVELVLRHAERFGIGTLVDLQPGSVDPYDPYAELRRLGAL